MVSVRNPRPRPPRPAVGTSARKERDGEDKSSSRRGGGERAGYRVFEVMEGWVFKRIRG